MVSRIPQSRRERSEPRSDAREEGARRPAGAWHDLLERVPELAEYASYYAAVQADRLRVAAQKAGWRLALTACGSLVGVAVLATAAILVVVGLAGAVGHLFPAAPWAGQLIVGAVVLLVLAAVLGGARARATRRTRKRLIEKYAARQRDQLAKFGRNVGGTHDGEP